MTADRPTLPARRRGFTLMEIVLAIALTAVVTYLLTTAIELYMVRVEASRGGVESAQLARTILDQMAADLTATRLDAPVMASPPPSTGDQQRSQGGQSSQGLGDSSTGGPNQSSGGTTTAGPTSGGQPAAAVEGLYGTTEQLRIDRSAPADWRRVVREIESTEPATVADLPQGIRYYLVDGISLTSRQLAEQGVNDARQAQAEVAGLYRETTAIAALREAADPLAGPTDRNDATVELLAPEVVKLEIHYFDGERMVDEWDAQQESSLPAGVEILLTLHEPSYDESEADRQERQRLTGQRYRESELVEYRRFVRLPAVRPLQPAELLLPQAGGPPPQGEASDETGGPPGGAAGGGNESS